MPTARHDSDVDLAILAPAPLGDEERWALAQDLAAALGRDVDLVDLLSASTVMRVQVIDSGQLLFESDATQRSEFEAVALGAYTRLNDEGFSKTFASAVACMDDVILNKVATIERCLGRVQEEYAGRVENLEQDLTRQDSIILNIQRACEASIDLAMHLVRRFKLGIPQESRHGFDLLVDAGKLDHAMADALKRMVGFRNIAVHDYQLNLVIVRAIIEHNLDGLRSFARHALTFSGT
jgi:uncharacterized protein YutE (UPF0331/DUF86 family)